ncbi:MAG: response regulator [Deltaproteobacteria bacterium]|nr:response regulator [Deltaproteobacteria bacterium]
MPLTGRVLDILMVEDMEDDALLLLRELGRSGYRVNHHRVDTADAMRCALRERHFDLVLSDYVIPGFGALEALSVLRASGLDLPFIIASGTIGEETAVESMRAGAHDFLLKDRLARLPAAIERELRAAASRRAGREEEEKNRALELARAEAERVSHFKSQFLANMSHELRTPLNAIIGFSELLAAQGSLGSLNDTQREFVGDIIASGHHLLTVINDILDLSAIEAGRVDLRRAPTRLGELVDGALQVGRALAVTQGVTLHSRVADGVPEVNVDPLRLRQVLINLCSNAIKFTRRGGAVTLEVSAHADRVFIAVIDTGVGIRPEDLGRLFREFGRLAQPDGSRIEGTGLGLALSKRLVELHGGQITVTSELGRGSTFTVELPARP